MVQCGRWVGNRTHSFDCASFNDLAWPLTQISGSRYYSTSNNSKMVLNIAVQGVSKKSSPQTFWNIFSSVESFCMKFCKFVGNSYPHISASFCTFILIFHQMALIFPRVPVVFMVLSFEYWMQTLRWTSTWWESHHFQLYPDKGWKLSTGKKVCRWVDHTGSAILRKPDSGTGRPATASACAVCRIKTLIPWVGSMKL